MPARGRLPPAMRPIPTAACRGARSKANRRIPRTPTEDLAVQAACHIIEQQADHVAYQPLHTNPTSWPQTSGALVAEAGCVLQALEDKVAKCGWMVPLDLGAKGSCQIGGNIATNAGVGERRASRQGVGVWDGQDGRGGTPVGGHLWEGHLWGGHLCVCGGYTCGGDTCVVGGTPVGGTPVGGTLVGGHLWEEEDSTLKQKASDHYVAWRGFHECICQHDSAFMQAAPGAACSKVTNRGQHAS
eukprot:351548-Chlamydomonas_euryale.AAC.3